MGFLEGHTASVRCLQMDDNIVATGSMDASIRLWDLSKAVYEPYEHKADGDDDDDAAHGDDGLGFGNLDEDEPPAPHADAMADCPLFVLDAHVDEVTALHLQRDTLVSGSADKTLRQWDLVKGRCVQTLDVLWAAAQASSVINGVDAQWRPSGRSTDAKADFVGALQCFDAALACGTADGMVRLWDLRSGQVHRSLVGHTAPVTCLQFDDTHIVTGSADRSVRVSLTVSVCHACTNWHTDMGPPYRQYFRCLCLRQCDHEHDVRRPTHRLRRRRRCGQSLRQDRWSTLELWGWTRRRRGWRCARHDRAGSDQGQLHDRRPQGRQGGCVDVLTAAKPMHVQYEVDDVPNLSGPTLQEGV